MKKILFCLFICFILIGCGKEQKKEEEKKSRFEYSNLVDHKTSIKYQSNVRTEIKDGELPNLGDVKKIFEEIKKDNKNYKNYFMDFYIDSKIPLFKISQLEGEDIRVSNLWNLLIYDNSIRIDEKYNKVSGFIKYSDVNLKNLESIEEVYSQLGKTNFEEEGKLVYIVFNKIGEAIVNIDILHEDGKVKKIDYSFGKVLKEEEKEKIKEYFLGNRDIEAKIFDNKNGMNISLKNLGKKFDSAKRMVGYVGQTITVEAPEDVEVILYDEEYGFKFFMYMKNKKLYKIEVIQTREKNEEAYSKFQEQIMTAYILAKDNSLDKEFYDTLEKIGFSYDRFMSNNKYSRDFERGYLKYNFINDGKINKFQIENID